MPSLKEALKGKIVPEWIKEFNMYKNRGDYEIEEGEKIYLYDFPISNFEDFKKIVKTIIYWIDDEILPYEFWSYVLNEKNKEKVLEYLNSLKGEKCKILMRYLKSKIKLYKGIAIQDFAENGEIGAVQYCCENNYPMDEYCCAYAASGGFLECLICLHEYNCPWDYRTLYKSVERDHFECFKYAHENNCPHTEDLIFECLFTHKSLKYFKFLIEDNFPFHRDKFFHYLEETKTLDLENGSELSEYVKEIMEGKIEANFV